MNWDTQVRELPMVGPIYAKRLEKLNITTVGDLLWHMPFRYEDYSLVSKIQNLQQGETVTVIGTITQAKNVFTKTRKQIQNIQLQDETGTISATWFNQPFLVRSLKIGERLAISGQVKRFGKKIQFESPEHEIIKDGKDLIHTGRLVPVYPETYGISSKWLRTRIAPLLETSLTNEYLPESIRTKYHFLDLKTALKQVHFPKKLSDVEVGKRRLAFDELFIFQLISFMKRKEWQSRTLTNPFTVDEEKVFSFINFLPFRLTQAQKKVTQEIIKDLKKDTSMNRLLQGDVGSGKTVVAAIAIYIAKLNGFLSLLMAPTEILANQHYQTLTQVLNPFAIKVGIQTGSQKSLKTENSKQLAVGSLPAGKAGSQIKPNDSQFDLIVGTHALIEKRVKLDRVGLVVIDEQHRFGVRQRALLREKGASPHLLTMTATPIPRTVALTLYGDLDLSVIDEMPHGRVSIKTWVVPRYKRNQAYEWIRKTIKESNYSERAFIVCPFIEPSESLQTVKAATAEFEKLSTQVFPDFKLGLLHGKLKSNAKNEIISHFLEGDLDILVATPVVEVGIDIPSATIMLIEAAERFGLAQLHQLRGRVGRGDKQAYCLLFTTSEDDETAIRLKSLEKSLTGAELAELDLKIRGPGQIYGTIQHGYNSLKVASFSDLTLIEAARTEAKELYAFDPELTNLPALKQRLQSATISEVTPD